ncbi:MAG: GH25 family lysozyme [Romboutsia timonensis]
MKVFGIDISTWQRGYPYDAANAEGVKFAILRAGFSQTKDNQFETHYANAKRLGWGVGAYWYMYATTVAAAQAEARAFLKAIAGKQFDYPVYLDIEDKTVRATGKANCDAMIRAFGEIIESAGYYFGVYTNLDWYRNVISGAELNKKYDWWIACWSTGAPTGVNYGLWQFGGETNYIRGNKVAGVTTDQNYAVKDYPTIIKNAGLNGYGKAPEPTPDPTPTPTPVQKFNIGDKVVVNGPLYVNANAANASGNVKNKVTTITRYVAGAKHPYNTYGDLGWMNESDISLYQESQAQYYTIQWGDTLYGLAIKFGTTIGELQRLNGIKNANKIYAGQKIRVK